MRVHVRPARLCMHAHPGCLATHASLTGLGFRPRAVAGVRVGEAAELPLRRAALLEQPACRARARSLRKGTPCLSRILRPFERQALLLGHAAFWQRICISNEHLCMRRLLPYRHAGCQFWRVRLLSMSGCSQRIWLWRLNKLLCPAQVVFLVGVQLDISAPAPASPCAADSASHSHASPPAEPTPVTAPPALGSSPTADPIRLPCQRQW